jgi:hypothetical protein
VLLVDPVLGQVDQRLVPCPGVRTAAGIGFPGTDASLYGYIGDVLLDNPPERGTVAVAGADGALIVVPLPDGRFRVGGFDPANQGP